jgi:hypothetical protein
MTIVAMGIEVHRYNELVVTGIDYVIMPVANIYQ